MKKVLVVVGTRPNLIKITKFKECFDKHSDLDLKILHAGQHYDYQMSEIFFEQLGIPKPDCIFKLDAPTAVGKIAEMMVKFEEFVMDLQPDLVLVPGDVNSSMACGVAASRLGFKVGHIESGLRSFDRTMPEEINRLIIDELSDLFFVTEPSGVKNLEDEKKDKGNVYFVGNTMIDSLVQFQPVFEKSDILEKLNVSKKEYFVFTFHRPGNVDDVEKLKELVSVIKGISAQNKVVFPVHPRTRKNLADNGLLDALQNENIVITEPVGYIDFMKLIGNSSGVITDSGGIQEETTFMQVPCLTIRPNTERPITHEIGTNTLLPLDQTQILECVKQISGGTYKKGEIPDNWDGNATDRIVGIIKDFLN
jgi:UDP-N-acetylglucosamine 2-epimerase (non-hydrolysing)|tara:strand:- start:178 stop:1272 length:1095 start_codon:yes stop_codon:yes gene_type:complete